MLAIEEVLRELSGEEEQQGLPPGFRFHPTDEELITFYLASKVFNASFSAGLDIAEVDLNRCEPWELPEVAKMGEREWYFFSLRDRKYPTGLRTNRATGAGYWKATGKDREVFNANHHMLIGMKKTLVFYKGRAPRGEKTKWVMHEYRLHGHFSCRHTSKEEWVICRIYHKSGDKKNPLFQGRQGYHLLEACLPKLLETNPTTDHGATATATSDTTTTTTSNTNANTTAATATTISPPTPTPTPTPTASALLLDQEYQTHNPNIIPMQALLYHQEGDLKALINNNVPLIAGSQSLHQQSFPVNGFQFVQPTFFSVPRDTTTSSKSPVISRSNNNPYPYPSPSAMLFKSLLSHQDYCKEQEQPHPQPQPQPQPSTVPKQCKTESSFTHFQPQPSSDEHDGHRNQVPYEYDHHYQSHNMLFDQNMDDYGHHVLGLSSVDDMSTSAAFNRSAFPLTKLPAESCWPLDACLD